MSSNSAGGILPISLWMRRLLNSQSFGVANGEVLNSPVAVVDQAVERFGHLDVFVSNAGVCEFREFLE